MKKLAIFIGACLLSSTVLVYGIGLTGTPLLVTSAIVGAILGIVL